MRLRILTFTGCPNAEPALALVGEVARELGIDTLQLGGDGVVADARPQRTDDRPPVAVLLASVEQGG